jgi:hypothetical protein
MGPLPQLILKGPPARTQGRNPLEGGPRWQRTLSIKSKGGAPTPKINTLTITYLYYYKLGRGPYPY